MEDRSKFDIGDRASSLIKAKVRQICRRPGVPRRALDVVEHDLSQHLHRRLAGFDPSRACLSTYLDRIGTRWIVSYLRHRFAERRDPRREEYSLDDPVPVADGRTAPKHETAPECARASDRLRDLERDMAKVISELPDDLRPIALCLALSSPHGAGVSLGVSRRAMTSAMERIREHFRDAGLEQYL